MPKENRQLRYLLKPVNADFYVEIKIQEDNTYSVFLRNKEEETLKETTKIITEQEAKEIAIKIFNEINYKVGSTLNPGAQNEKGNKT